MTEPRARPAVLHAIALARQRAANRAAPTRGWQEPAPRSVPLSLWLVAVVALLIGACTGDISAPGQAPGGKSASGTAVPRVLGAPRVRLLSGAEYHSTVRDLLGLEASPAIAHADHGAGFDSGAMSRLDENLFRMLYDEAERLAAEYVETRLAADYPCFSKSSVEDGCVAHIIEHLGRRAFRRPLSTDDKASLMALFGAIAADSADRVLATRSVITRMLGSVGFLYRTELGKPKGKTRVLDAFERASLVSYALTGSMPDDALLDDAQKYALGPVRMRHHVRRLLATPAGRARVVDVIRQWLRASELEAMVNQPESYPKLQSVEQAAALRDEFSAFVSDVVFGSAGSLTALLTSSHTFVNQHTAPLYGLQTHGDWLVRVQLDPSERRGVLTLASVMAVHSSVGDVRKDRPVLRGLLIKNRLLCEEVGLPSGIDTAAAAMNLTLSAGEFDELTTREQFEAMMNQGEECKSCHQQFMPMGYLLGNLDALGRAQTHKGDRLIDTSVSALPIAGASESYADFVGFIDELASSDIVSRCFTQNLVAYALGSAKGPHVDYLTSAMSQRFSDAGGDIQTLLEELLVSPELYERAVQP